MATKDELHTLAMSLFDNAKDDLARDGWVMKTHMLLKRNGQKLCIADAGMDKDAMARTLKALAPACKAVGSTFEAWMAPEHVGVRLVSAPRCTPTASKLSWCPCSPRKDPGS